MAAALMIAGASLAACASADESRASPAVGLMEVAAHAGHSMIPAMRSGDVVRFVADPMHPFEPDAVAAYWGAFKLGYLPREASADLRCPPACSVGDELPVGRIVSAASGAISVEIVKAPWSMARYVE